MKGYVTLTVEMPEELDPSVFPQVLEQVKTALVSTAIERVVEVNVALGPQGLDEVMTRLSGQAAAEAVAEAVFPEGLPG